MHEAEGLTNAAEDVTTTYDNNNNNTNTNNKTVSMLSNEF